MTYPYAYGCGPLEWTVDRYWKYKNPDPSTAKYTPAIVDEIITSLEEQIAERSHRIYKVRPQAIIARDFRHSVIREIAYWSIHEVLKIDRFEKENSGDIRNYTDPDDTDPDGEE